MIGRLKIWFKTRFSGKPATPPARDLNRSGAHAAPRRPPVNRTAGRPAQPSRPSKPQGTGLSDDHGDTIESLGPGKNVLIRNKFVREDTGTHETLKILDDSLIDSGEETGLDPYNTGGFDRSKNWDRRFGK